jgi:hypothetical protein
MYRVKPSGAKSFLDALWRHFDFVKFSVSQLYEEFVPAANRLCSQKRRREKRQTVDSSMTTTMAWRQQNMCKESRRYKTLVY